MRIKIRKLNYMCIISVPSYYCAGIPLQAVREEDTWNRAKILKYLFPDMYSVNGCFTVLQIPVILAVIKTG